MPFLIIILAPDCHNRSRRVRGLPVGNRHHSVSPPPPPCPARLLQAPRSPRLPPSGTGTMLSDPRLHHCVLVLGLVEIVFSSQFCLHLPVTVLVNISSPSLRSVEAPGVPDGAEEGDYAEDEHPGQQPRPAQRQVARHRVRHTHTAAVLQAGRADMTDRSAALISLQCSFLYVAF